MIILIGMVSMEFLGMLALAGLSMLGLGRGAVGVATRGGASRCVRHRVRGDVPARAHEGLISLGEIDTYSHPRGHMHDVARSRRRVRPQPRTQRRAVVIEY